MLRGMSRKQGPRRVFYFGPFSRYKAQEGLSLDTWSVYDAESIDGAGLPAFVRTMSAHDLGIFVEKSLEYVAPCQATYPSRSECLWINCEEF